MDMSRFFKYDDALKKAIENNELGKLMLGEGKYHYEDSLSEGLVDEVKLYSSIYKMAEQDSRVKDYFIDELFTLSQGTADEMIECLQYLYVHLINKQFNDNTFDFLQMKTFQTLKEV